MSPSGRVWAFAATAMVAAGVAGCGETVIDAAKTEDAIEHNLERASGLKVTSVDCPTDVEVETGATFQCVVEQPGGKEETATLKIRNEDADVSLVDLSANK
jgi:NAD(P)H-hydrate repair Nnr-like enzyme with NAD(P)H-hydrate epimerase domain